MSFIAILFLASTAFVQATDKPGHRDLDSIIVLDGSFNFDVEQRLCLQGDTFHTAVITLFSIPKIDISKPCKTGDKIQLALTYIDTVYGENDSCAPYPRIDPSIQFSIAENSCWDHKNPKAVIDCAYPVNLRRAFQRRLYAAWKVKITITVDLVWEGESCKQETTLEHELNDIDGGLAIVLITQDPLIYGNLSPDKASYKLRMNGTPIGLCKDTPHRLKANPPQCYQKLSPNSTPKQDSMCPCPSESWFSE